MVNKSTLILQIIHYNDVRVHNDDHKTVVLILILLQQTLYLKSKSKKAIRKVRVVSASSVKSMNFDMKTPNACAKQMYPQMTKIDKTK